MNASRAANRVAMTLGGKGVTSRAGTLVVADLADQLGLTEALSEGMAPVVQRRRRRDPGVALCHIAVLLVDGGDCLSDLAVLRNEPDLFGTVASDSTAERALESGWAKGAITEARKVAREVAWEGGAAPATVTLELDATLLDAHSDKEDAAPTYKGGFGFHPLCCFLDETNEALAGKLRAGNAGANDANDHIEVLAAAMDQLPEGWRSGHELGDDPAAVVHPILVRADSAGATHDFVDEVVGRTGELSVGFHIDQNVRNALGLAQEEDWVPAIELDGTVRDGAFVIELTELIDLDRWGTGMRLFSRRERPHPGAQLSLLEAEDGWRYTLWVTNRATDTKGRLGQCAYIDAAHRVHARVEDVIRTGKDTGLGHFPSHDYKVNQAWLDASMIACILLAWLKLIALDGDLARAEPKTLRYRVLHAAARLVRGGRRRFLKIAGTWPWADPIVTAWQRIQAIPHPT